MLSGFANVFGVRQHQKAHVRPSVSVELLEYYLYIDVYHELIAQSDARAAKLSSILIYPYQNLSFNSSTRDLTRMLGKPNHKLKLQDTLTEQLLFYRKIISNYKAHVEFHFREGRLFYARRTFRYTSDQERNNIIAEISSKYLGNGELNAQVEKIVDPQGHALVINRGAYLAIDYLDIQGPIFSQLRNRKVASPSAPESDSGANDEISRVI